MEGSVVHLPCDSEEVELELSHALSMIDLLQPEAARCEIRAVLAAAEADLHALDDNISQTDSDILLEDLRSQRVNAIKRVRFCRTAMSPLQKLPSEILSEIFSHCAHRLMVPSDNNICPSNLLLVCSRWRQVALQTSDLWRTISVDYRTTKILELSKKASEIMSRCRSSPVELRLDGPCLGVCIPPTRGSSNPISDLLIAHASHFESLTMHNNYEWLEPFLECSIPSMELLRSVNLIVGGAPDITKEFPVFQYAHNLTQFTIELDIYPVNPDYALIRPLKFHLFWDKLTELNFYECFVQPSEILLILSICDSLTTFGFRLSVDFPEQQVSIDHLPPVLVHPNLQSIVMQLHSNQPIGQFLRRIEFPHLKVLRFGCEQQIPENDWNQVFVPFVARSPHIKDISLFGYVPDSTASALLSILPELLAVCFGREGYLMKSTFERIVYGDMAPRLKTFSLAVDLFDPFLEVLEHATSPNILAKPGFQCITFYLDWRDRVIWEKSERVTSLRLEGRFGQINFI